MSDERRLTPRHVLDILREEHRQYCANDEGDPSIVLEFDTTLYDWWFGALIIDSPGAGGIAHHLNQLFELNIDLVRWRRTVRPWRSQTLRDVCELVASEARVSVIRPATVLGRRCLPAGAFLTLRDRLARVGFDTSGLRPSTPLSEYLRVDVWSAIAELMKLAPGRLPAIRVHRPVADWTERIVVVSMLVLVLSMCLSCFSEVFIVTNVLGLFVLLGAWAISYAVAGIRPKRVEFGGLVDFRDLSYAMVGQTPPPRVRKTRQGGVRPSQ